MLWYSLCKMDDSKLVAAPRLLLRNSRGFWKGFSFYFLRWLFSLFFTPRGPAHITQVHPLTVNDLSNLWLWLSITAGIAGVNQSNLNGACLIILSFRMAVLRWWQHIGLTSRSQIETKNHCQDRPLAQLWWLILSVSTLNNKEWTTNCLYLDIYISDF